MDLIIVCSLAIVARVRRVAVCRQVYGSTQRGAARCRFQSPDANGFDDGRSHKNVAIQHDEGESILNDLKNDFYI